MIAESISPSSGYVSLLSNTILYSTGYGLGSVLLGEARVVTIMAILYRNIKIAAISSSPCYDIKSSIIIKSVTFAPHKHRTHFELHR